jgi:hypothetical protein
MTKSDVAGLVEAGAGVIDPGYKRKGFAPFAIFCKKIYSRLFAFIRG